MEGGAQFGIGTIIRHKLFGYRGVVFDVDPVFNGTDDWYESMARSRPPKDKPWYHVLPDGQRHTTYVAERNLEPDPDPAPIRHPLLDDYFDGRTDDGYNPVRRAN
jgi:heat shock protein HspQ